MNRNLVKVRVYISKVEYLYSGNPGTPETQSVTKWQISDAETSIYGDFIHSQLIPCRFRRWKIWNCQLLPLYIKTEYVIIVLFIISPSVLSFWITIVWLFSHNWLLLIVLVTSKETSYLISKCRINSWLIIWCFSSVCSLGKRSEYIYPVSRTLKCSEDQRKQWSRLQSK